jgi:hypothetical protein
VRLITARNAAFVVRELAEQNKNRLIVDVPEDLGALTADPIRLKQILLTARSRPTWFPT